MVHRHSTSLGMEGTYAGSERRCQAWHQSGRSQRCPCTHDHQITVPLHAVRDAAAQATLIESESSQVSTVSVAYAGETSDAEHWLAPGMEHQPITVLPVLHTVRSIYEYLVSLAPICQAILQSAFPRAVAGCRPLLQTIQAQMRHHHGWPSRPPLSQGFPASHHVS